MKIKDDLFVEPVARELPSLPNRSFEPVGSSGAPQVSSRSLFETVFSDTLNAASPQTSLPVGAEMRPQFSTGSYGALPGLMMAGEKAAFFLGANLNRRNKPTETHFET